MEPNFPFKLFSPFKNVDKRNVPIFSRFLTQKTVGTYGTYDYYKGHLYIYGLLRFCVNHGQKFENKAVNLHLFLYNYRLHIELTFILKTD